MNFLHVKLFITSAMAVVQACKGVAGSLYNRSNRMGKKRKELIAACFGKEFLCVPYLRNGRVLKSLPQSMLVNLRLYVARIKCAHIQQYLS